MTRFIVLTVVVLSAYPAAAETIIYKCRSNGRTFEATIDDAKNILAWKGKIYKITEAESCAKFGWRAERNGEGFNFCTATQGYADFQENGKLIRCNQTR